MPRYPRALVNILLGGALLRLMGVGVHPLWLDEGATWSWASRETWGGTIFAEANHPPAWWIVTRLWISAFGDTEASLRAPAALLGVLSIFLAWLFARRLLDPAHRPRRGGFDRTPDGGAGARRALWFAGFVAASSYFTEYAQEARMYAALIAEGLGLSLLYLRWLDRGGRGALVGYALLAALALHTHYFAVWILAGHGAHALWLWHRTRAAAEPVRIRPFVLANVTALLLFAPWLLYMVRHYEGISTGDPFEPFGRLFYVLWRIGAGPGVVVVDRPRLEDGIPAVLAEEAPMVAATILLWIPALVLGALRLRRVPGVASLVAACVLVPIVLWLAVFPFFPLIHERYLTFLAPWLFLLAVIGAFGAARWLKPLLVGGLCVLTAIGALAYHGAGTRLEARDISQSLGDVRVAAGYATPADDPLRFLHHGHAYGKEPWRQAHAFVADHAAAGDLVLLHPPYLHLVWDYYDRGAHEQIRLPREAAAADEIDRRFGARLARATRVFLLLAHEETDDADHYVRAVRDVVSRRWLADGLRRFQVVKPILFDRSWGVRVAVFNRR
jgi:4-amino-4-deoxy-L-arabinose transferase-like glycosyltransferase